jgi:clan AA aspartic protease
MMRGLVTAEREAIIAVMVRGPNGQDEMIEAVIDTGFNGFLTLPAALIASLALPFVGVTRAALGDGHEVNIDVFEAMVLWDNQEREVLLLGAGGAPLVGMSLLSDYRLTLEVKDGGAVMIEALP